MLFSFILMHVNVGSFFFFFVFCFFVGKVNISEIKENEVRSEARGHN